MEELEARAAAMAWDWSGDEIAEDEDDGKAWVPVTLLTLGAGRNETVHQTQGDTTPVQAEVPSRQMAVYAVRPSRDGRVEQASSPTIIPVLTPMPGILEPIKENLGEEDSPREEETTADEEGESEVSEGSTTTPAKTPKARPRKGGKKGVPKKAEVVVLAEPRKLKCDRCKARNRPCMPRTKGGRHLDACAECFGRKVSCRTGGAGGRKKRKNVEESTDSGQSTEDDAGGRGWLERHSTKVGPHGTSIKVGPPTHAKPTGAATEGTKAKAETRNEPMIRRTTTRNAGLVAKKRIERFRE